MVCTTSAARRRSRISAASAVSPAPASASSTVTGSGGSCFGARGGGPHDDVAAHPRRELAHDLADRGREHVDAAHDEHVVRAPDAPDPDPVAPARARARADAHVVTGAEPQQRRRPVADVREHELALRAVDHGHRRARCRVDELRVHELRGAEVHAVLRLALAEQGDADVADPHRLGHPRAPARLEPRAEAGLAAARLAGDEHAADGGRGEVDPALRRPLDGVGGVGGRHHDRLRLEVADRGDEPLRVPRPDRDVAQPDAVEGGERRARGERAGVVGADDPLAGADARQRVRARGARDPVVDVTRGERDVARLARRAARGVDPRDLGTADAAVRAEGVLGRDRRAQLLLGRERERLERSVHVVARELLAVEGRPLEQIGDLLRERPAHGS